MFEQLAVLDGSLPGSVDAVWTESQCAKYANVRYRLEAHANVTQPVSDQTTRDAATRLLLGPDGDTRPLIGRWMFLAHPDEFYLQDVRSLVASLSQRDPRATCVLFGAAYVLPTPAEHARIVAQHSGAAGHETFEAIEHLSHADEKYTFREPRLFKWTPNTRWGTRHSITTPERHPNHRQWPVAREVALGRSPFFVHFKIHDFGTDAFALVEGRPSGRNCRILRNCDTPWIAFNNSGFSTGLAPHRLHGRLRIDTTRSANEQALSYYELAGREPTPLRAQIRRLCSTVVPECTVPWERGAYFPGRGLVKSGKSPVNSFAPPRGS